MSILIRTLRPVRPRHARASETSRERRSSRARAVTAARRFALLQEVPTVSGSGSPGCERNPCSGSFAPAGLPATRPGRQFPEIIRRTRRRGFARALAGSSAEPWIGAREPSAARIRLDHERYDRRCRQRGFAPA